MSQDSSFENRVGTLLNGKWQLERLLGVGGMAAVYLGRHHIGRYDAIKMLHPRLAEVETLRKRFAREAKAVNKFRHPGAVNIRDIDVADDDGSPFLVMEYLEGSPLNRVVKQPGGISLADLLRTIDEMLDVLASAHDHGIVHRDIKPGNIFILHDGSVKVLDFGIVRMTMDVNSVYTREGVLLGTASYMPPEQIRGGEIDGRVDIFAVGATMYRILARRPIHREKSQAELLVKMATEPAPGLLSLAPDVPPDVAAVVDRAVSFNREHRYPDARTMQADIRSLRRGDRPAFALAPVPGSMSNANLNAADEDAELGEHRSRAKQLQLEQAKALLGTTVGGRYELTKLLGKGGMGAVYEAKNRAGERFAIKVILTHLMHNETNARARFQREAQATMLVQHDKVVRVVEADFDEEAKFPFIVMDLLQGQDAEQLLKATKPLVGRTAAAIVAQACEGVTAAHEQGVVHRDIKPANIFLHDNGADTICVKLCDFGLAKTRSTDTNQSAASLTQSGGVLGTPKYASPEQLTNAKRVDVQSDVWGLCLCLHEMVSGQKPWKNCETVGELILAICTTDVPRLERIAPWVEPELAAIVHRGLHRAPEQRWPTVNALHQALLSYLKAAPSLTGAMLTAVDTGGYDIGAESEAETVISSNQLGLEGSVPALTRSPEISPPATRKTGVWVAAAAACILGGAGASYLAFGAPGDRTPHDATTPVAAGTGETGSTETGDGVPTPPTADTPTATPTATSEAPAAVSASASASAAVKRPPVALQRPIPRRVAPKPTATPPPPRPPPPPTKPNTTSGSPIKRIDTW